MPVDRIFASQEELDAAQGNNEFVEGEIYLLQPNFRLLLAIAPAETKAFFGDSDNANFAGLNVDYLSAAKMRVAI